MSFLSSSPPCISAHAGIVPPRGHALFKTDLSIAVPDHCYGRVGMFSGCQFFQFFNLFICSLLIKKIAPRSGLALKHGIDVGAGVIDADYRGNLGVILFNHSDADFQVKPGDRIAQLILERIETPEVMECLADELLPETTRGEAGFGSTGK